jgi:2'-5' RNA ligase
MRLFTGIAIAPEVLKNLEETLNELRPLARLNWSPAGNLHITTRFIGQWPEDRLEDLRQALAAIQAPDCFDVHVAGFGYFPNPRSPRVLFTNISAGPSLAQLAQSLNDRLEALGCEKEERPYNPHLTLARIKHENIEGLRQHLTSMQNTDFGTFAAHQFHLYLSKPGPRGSVYTQLGSWPLGLGK